MEWKGRGKGKKGKETCDLTARDDLTEVIGPEGGDMALVGCGA